MDCATTCTIIAWGCLSGGFLLGMGTCAWLTLSRESEHRAAPRPRSYR